VDSHVERQPLFSEPRRVQDRYAAGEDSGEDAGKVPLCTVQQRPLLFAYVIPVSLHSVGTGRRAQADGTDGHHNAQAFVSLNWVLSEEPLDLETELALDFLDYLLVHSHC
jgi:hypothetical protein